MKNIQQLQDHYTKLAQMWDNLEEDDPVNEKNLRLFRRLMESIQATHAYVVFDGSGDSGMMRLSSVKRKGKGISGYWIVSEQKGSTDVDNRVIEMPSEMGEGMRDQWRNSEQQGWVRETVQMTHTLADVCEEMAYWVTNTGWENNEGGYGEVEITLDGIKSKVRHRARYGREAQVDEKTGRLKAKGQFMRFYKTFEVSPMQEISDQLVGGE